MRPPVILLVSQNLQAQQTFASAVGRCGSALVIASTIDEAEGILIREPISMVFCSDELPRGEIDGLIEHASKSPRRLPAITLSADELNNHRGVAFLVEWAALLRSARQAA